MQAVAAFSRRFPRIGLDISGGSHGRLYQLLTGGQADLVFSDQRRDLSRNFVNLYLTSSRLVAVVARQGRQRDSRQSPQRATGSADVRELADLPVILLASDDQRSAEEDFHHSALGLTSRCIFASSREEAQLLMAANQGYLLMDEGESAQVDPQVGRALALTRQGEPLVRKYYAFWSRDNSGYYVEAFAQLLKSQFQ
ncbi:LysR family transcriptional regulator substrate-binding protein [Bifidobacterium actinocoloniiforme]|uniref:LysR family transcriptional regulator substrate-binding protein n=1 Tax=Bifidobacterium actinocoloniiforme TaxID=638619 RepID=UPI0009DEE022|nr:LysR family transcriptional regulator substrate-binding protein [Bifidobacterium actinocoloniiforme]